MKREIGIFFLLVGVICLAIFFVFGGQAQGVQLFCIGAPLAALGGWLVYQTRDRTPAVRFRFLKKILSKKKK